MARVYFRNEWPEFTLSPNQMDLLDDDGYVAEGLTLDKIAVDIYDDILQPEDFEIQYTITPGNTLVPWKTCSDRNFIEISEQARQGSVSIFMEIRDVVGNYRPYSISFPKRGEAGECRIHMDQLNILAGESMYDYLPIHQYNPWHEDPMQEMNFQHARRVFKQNQYVT